MPQFKINDALAFLSVIDEGSFAAAAKLWGISSSVISKRISRLENDLHIQLLQRTTRTLVLTEAGQAFYDRCKRIQTEINEAALDITQHHSHLTGLLRVNSPMSFGLVHLVPAVNDFIKLYPDIQIEVILGSQYANFIYSGLDLAIFIKDLPNTHLLKSRKIASRSTGIYASPEYFKRYPMPIHPNDLVNHNCLIYQPEPGNQLALNQKFRWAFHENGKKFHVPVSGSLRVNSSQALVQAALAGIGLVKLSSFMVTNEIKKGSLVNVLNDYCVRDIDIHAAYPNQRYVPSKVSVFLNFLVERFNMEYYWDNE